MKSPKMDKTEIFKKLNEAYFGENRNEREVIDDLAFLLKDFAMFIDVGASLGQYTYFANQFLNGALIYSIEADPIRFEMLKQNCESWEKEGTNKIIPIHAIAAEEEGRGIFYSTESNISGSTFRIPQRSQYWTKLEVDSIVLDKFYEQEKKIFVKIDVEGGEYRVLRGSRKLLTAGNATFLMELHSWGDAELKKYPHHVIKLLYEHSYQMEKAHFHYLFKRSSRRRSLPLRYYYLCARHLAYFLRGLNSGYVFFN